jgi:hypothetical protein
MPGIIDAQALWEFLRSIHPLFLFSESLPTIDGAEQGWYSTLHHGDELDRLKNEITTLRSDLNLNIIKQHQVDIEQLRDESDIDELIVELETLLDVFEGLVDDQILDLPETSGSAPKPLVPLFLTPQPEDSDTDRRIGSRRC